MHWTVWPVVFMACQWVPMALDKNTRQQCIDLTRWHSLKHYTPKPSMTATGVHPRPASNSFELPQRWQMFVIKSFLFTHNILVLWCSCMMLGTLQTTDLQIFLCFPGGSWRVGGIWNSGALCRWQCFLPKQHVCCEPGPMQREGGVERGGGGKGCKKWPSFTCLLNYEFQTAILN